VRNESPQQLIQYLLKIQLNVELTVNTLQKCHDTEAAQLKRLKSAQKAMKKHLSTLQNEIAMDYNLLEKNEHDNQDNTTCD
jgi:hypothetical protein